MEWDANPESGIVGYRVYNGSASRQYTHVVDVGLQSSLPLTNYPAGVTRYFTVIAYDSDQVESSWSEEVSFTPPVDGVMSGFLPHQLSVASSGITIQFNGRAGQQCRIAASFDLETWEEIYSVTMAGNEPVAFVDTARSSMRFYRVIANPPAAVGAPVLFQLTVSDGIARIKFDGRASQRYRIMISLDLNEWQEIHEVSPAQDQPVTFIDGDEIQYTSLRFYRVVATPE